MSKVAYARSIADVDYSNPVNAAWPVNRGLVAWWKSRPGISGNPYQWRDTVGRNHGTLTNMASGSGWGGSPAPGGLGPSMRFDGVDDKIAIPFAANQNLGNAGTIILSAKKAADGPSAMSLLDKNNEINVGGQGYVIYYDPRAGQHKLTFELGGAAGTFQQFLSDVAIANNTWVRIAVTWDGFTITLYINGLPVASTAQTITAISNGSGGITIGGSPSGTARPWNGLIDSVKPIARALSPAEIAWEYIDERLGCPWSLNRLGGLTAAQQAAAYAAYFRMLQQNIGAAA